MIYVGPTRVPPTLPTSASGMAGPSSPLTRVGFGDPGIDVGDDYGLKGDGDAELNKKRLSSGQFRQDGGILGRLGFETNDVSELPVERDGSEEPPRQDAAISQEPLAAAEKYEILATAPEEPEGRVSEEMELFESAEKKNKFWIGRRRSRRMSKATSDVEDDARVSDSLTPSFQKADEISLARQHRESPPLPLFLSIPSCPTSNRPLKYIILNLNNFGVPPLPSSIHSCGPFREHLCCTPTSSHSQSMTEDFS